MAETLTLSAVISVTSLAEIISDFLRVTEVTRSLGAVCRCAILYWTKFAIKVTLVPFGPLHRYHYLHDL